MLNKTIRSDKRRFYKEGQFINQAPVKEKPSFVEQTKNLAGSIFNAVTGTQPAAASQIPGGMPTGTQFTSSNLDAAKPNWRHKFCIISHGRTTSKRRAGTGRQRNSTPFSQTHG